MIEVFIDIDSETVLNCWSMALLMYAVRRFGRIGEMAAFTLPTDNLADAVLVGVGSEQVGKLLFEAGFPLL